MAASRGPRTRFVRCYCCSARAGRLRTAVFRTDEAIAAWVILQSVAYSVHCQRVALASDGVLGTSMADSVGSRSHAGSPMQETQDTRLVKVKLYKSASEGGQGGFSGGLLELPTSDGFPTKKGRVDPKYWSSSGADFCWTLWSLHASEDDVRS